MDPNRTRAIQTDPNRTQMGTAPVADPNRTIMGSPLTVEATTIIKPTQCPVCKAFNPMGVMFCVDCGLIFERALPDDAFGAPAVQVPMLVDAGGKEFPVRPGETTVGREGDIAFADVKVSRRHAKFISRDGTVTLEELGSTNGTKVDGEKLEPGVPVTLQGGEKLSFGGVEATFSLPGAKGGNQTQTFAGNKTSAMAAVPRADGAAVRLVGGDLDLPLRPGANVFGRKSENALVISDPYVSGKHGVIELEGDEVYVTDTGSTNGTLLNDAKLVPHMKTKLNPDDVIRLGSLELRVVRPE